MVAKHNSYLLLCTPYPRKYTDRQFCKEAGITLKELGEKIGITEATAQKYEAGNIKKIDIEMLKKISDALGTTPEKLTGWKANLNMKNTALCAKEKKRQIL